MSTTSIAQTWAQRFEDPCPEARMAWTAGAGRTGAELVHSFVEILVGEAAPGRRYSALSRRGALVTLQQLRAAAKPALDTLIALLSDADASVRAEAAAALGAMGREARAAVPLLVGTLLAPPRDNANEAFQAARALGQIGGPEAVDGLTRALSNEADVTQWMCRASAAAALAELGPEAKAAIPALRAKLDDSHALLRQRAALALQRIDPTAEPNPTP